MNDTGPYRTPDRPVVKPRPITRKFSHALYFWPFYIEPGTTAIMSVTVNDVELFCWHRLVNKGALDGLWIVGFMIGSGCSEFAAGTEIPLRNFRYTPGDEDRSGHTAQHGQSIHVSIQNRASRRRLVCFNLEGKACT